MLRGDSTQRGLVPPCSLVRSGTHAAGFLNEANAAPVIRVTPTLPQIRINPTPVRINPTAVHVAVKVAPAMHIQKLTTQTTIKASRDNLVAPPGYHICNNDVCFGPPPGVTQRITAGDTRKIDLSSKFR
jgi:hypothetical protein